MFENEVKYRILKAALKSLFYQEKLSIGEYKNKLLEIQEKLKPEFINLEDWEVEEMVLKGIADDR